MTKLASKTPNHEATVLSSNPASIAEPKENKQKKESFAFIVEMTKDQIW